MFLRNDHAFHGCPLPVLAISLIRIPVYGESYFWGVRYRVDWWGMTPWTLRVDQKRNECAFYGVTHQSLLQREERSWTTCGLVL